MTIGQLPWALHLSPRRRDDVEWIAAAEILCRASIAEYNRAVGHFNAGRIPEALDLAEESLRLMPYASEPVELAARLHAQHGELVRAHQLASYASQMNWTWAKEVEAVTHFFTTRYNILAEHGCKSVLDPLSLPSYREAKLQRENHLPKVVETIRELAEPLDNNIDSNSRVGVHEAHKVGEPYRSSWLSVAGVWATSVAVAVFAGMWIGIPTLLPSNPPEEVVSNVYPVEPSLSAQVLDLLDSGDPSGALRLAIESDVSANPALARLATLQLFTQARISWQQRNYKEVYSLLSTTEGHIHLLPTYGLYMLSVAASLEGHRDIAFTAAVAFLEGRQEEQTRAARGQALYIAATHSTVEDGASYARLLRQEFPGSIYENSIVVFRSTHDISH